MPSAAVQILVCTNQRDLTHSKPSCGGLRNGLEVYRSFKDAVRARGVRDSVLVTRTGCLHRCSLGAVVTVWPANESFANVGIDDVEAILDHALGGDRQEVDRLRMPEGDWE